MASTSTPTAESWALPTSSRKATPRRASPPSTMPHAGRRERSCRRHASAISWRIRCSRTRSRQRSTPRSTPRSPHGWHRGRLRSSRHSSSRVPRPRSCRSFPACTAMSSAAWSRCCPTTSSSPSPGRSSTRCLGRRSAPKATSAPACSRTLRPTTPTTSSGRSFDAWAYGVGDLLLGTNPVSSEVDSVAEIEMALQEVIHTFGLEDVLPHCVLAHIDVQAEVEKRFPGSTELWFQSLGRSGGRERDLRHLGREDGRARCWAHRSLRPLLRDRPGRRRHQRPRQGLRHGSARGPKVRFRPHAAAREVAAAQQRAGSPPRPWVHVNDVAGFIGPEVFRTREQLVRCCLEDTVMGKLHGLTIGLDICSTLHMSIDLDDLDWCIEQIVPANPAYLMALPTKNEPDAELPDDRLPGPRQGEGDVRLPGRRPHVGVLSPPRCHRRRRPSWARLRSARASCISRIVDASTTTGPRTGFSPKPRARCPRFASAESSSPLVTANSPGTSHRSSMSACAISTKTPRSASSPTCPDEFPGRFRSPVQVRSQSKDRTDYILHPPTGEVLESAAVLEIASLRANRDDSHDVQLVVSDGLNALALTDEHHLDPYLKNTLLETRGGRFPSRSRNRPRLFGPRARRLPHRRAALPRPAPPSAHRRRSCT